MKTHTKKSATELTAAVAWGSMVGGRKRQEDYCAAMSWPNGFRLLVLGDGMGGEVGGAEASRLVVEGFRDSFVAAAEAGTGSDTRTRLLNALENANQCITDAVLEDRSMWGMGTTLVGMAFDSTAAAVHWLSVGDSPLWLYRGGAIKRLNENHSMGGRLDERAAAGQITWEQAAAARNRHQLLEAVCGQRIKLIDVPKDPFPVAAGDILLLASDGVETCSLQELEETIAAAGRDPDALTEAILQRVKEHGRPTQDNATLMVMTVGNGECEPDTAR